MCGRKKTSFVPSILMACLVALLTAHTTLAQAVEAPPLDAAGVAAERTLPRAQKSTSSRTKMILGLSWHPGFCEGRPKLPECATLKPDDPAATQFSLQGLWRARQTYCGVGEPLKAADKKRDWLSMPELALEPTLKLQLAAAMPGVASGFERHEWIKHGTCSGEFVGTYYERALSMLSSVNGSAVGALFKANIGKTLGEAEVKAAFDAAFGPGAGERVKMRCRKDGERRVITGLSIGLGDAKDDEALPVLIARAGETKFGCEAGVVDAAGQQ